MPLTLSSGDLLKYCLSVKLFLKGKRSFFSLQNDRPKWIGLGVEAAVYRVTSVILRFLLARDVVYGHNTSYGHQNATWHYRIESVVFIRLCNRFLFLGAPGWLSG